MCMIITIKWYSLSLFSLPSHGRLIRKYQYITKKVCCLFVLFLIKALLFSPALAQSLEVRAAEGQQVVLPLTVGDSVPQSVWDLPIKALYHPKGKTSITLNEYRDKKLIILDFWATSCGTCIQSFPKFSEMTKLFKDELYILPVTVQDSAKINGFLEKRADGYLKSLTYLVDAKDVKAYFPHVYIPHVVVLSKDKVLSSETASKVDAYWILNLLMEQTKHEHETLY